MEANCGAIPKALVRERRLANRQHPGSLCDALVFDVSEPGGILVAEAATCRPRRRVSDAGVLHLSRLRVTNQAVAVRLRWGCCLSAPILRLRCAQNNGLPRF